MHKNETFRPTRLVAFLLVGPLFLLILVVLAYVHFKITRSGISAMMADSFALRPIRQFGIQYGLRIVLPIYLGAGALAWILSLLPGALVRPAWIHDWKGREALGFGFSSLLWAHTVLWWQVPSTLWVMPGLRAVPFFICFPLLAALSLAYPIHWLARLEPGRALAKAGVLGLWILAWTGMATVPQQLPRLRSASQGGSQPCKVLILGIDGLRSDTFLENGGGLRGIPYRNTYTVIPATRLLWHILWGGDILTYTIGHAAPSMEEYTSPHNLKLLKEAKELDWKPRFYMDDGGTIGTAGRQMDLDDLLMPALGWENFVNSNLASSFPLYAIWENWFKPFPTTNPWANLDDGLKEAIRLGRGSGWVMYHSCLAHQPIFLDRHELGRTGRWWVLPPKAFEPESHILNVTRKEVFQADARTNPYLAYQIRMRSLLDAWKPIWNGLTGDPDYKDAVRVLFSDHGERFHYVGSEFQLQGVHGFNLDPWECRATMLVAGPGFSDAVGVKPVDATISLLNLRDGVRRLVEKKGAFDAAFFEACSPKAYFRYHTLATSAFGPEPLAFRAEPLTDLTITTYLAPNGVWFTKYDRTAQERAEDASVGFAVGPDSTYFKPLKEGGAMKTSFHGYDLVTETRIDEKAFQQAKKDVEQALSDKTMP